jgi:hypothetical protein
MLNNEQLLVFTKLYIHSLGDVEDGKAAGWEEFVAAAADMFGWSNETVKVEKIRKRGKHAGKKYTSTSNEARANVSKIENELRKAGVDLPVYLKTRGRKKKEKEPKFQVKLLNGVIAEDIRNKAFTGRQLEEMKVAVDSARSRTRKPKGPQPVQMDIERD